MSAIPQDKTVAEQRASAIAHLTYDQRWYWRYENASGPDGVKKTLELDHAKDLMLYPPPAHHKRSLDIGCATGRYPFFLAQQGFDAYGCDDSFESIQICEHKLLGAPYLRVREQLHFQQEDIITATLEPRSFALITSMMGTFNHFDGTTQTDLLHKYFAALQPGGRLMLSLWNPLCPFLNYLTLYDAAAKAELREKLYTPQEMVARYQEVGYENVQCEMLCFLTDDQALNLAKHDSHAVRQADDQQGELTGQGQMFIVCGDKPKHV